MDNKSNIDVVIFNVLVGKVLFFFVDIKYNRNIKRFKVRV